MTTNNDVYDFDTIFYDDYYGVKWAPTGENVTITWDIVTDVLELPLNSGTVEALEVSINQENIIAQAFDLWDAELQTVTFQKTDYANDADVAVAIVEDLATWGWWNSAWYNSIIYDATIRLDGKDIITDDALLQTTLHEIGNVLGLGDISPDLGIKSVQVDPFPEHFSGTQLWPDDGAMIRQLYGEAIIDDAPSADTTADPSSDIVIVQRGIVGKGSGYDKYILSKWTVDADAEITITDSGDNALQFINGFEVSSSMVAANAMLLTLSNGAVVTVLDASSYDYTVGGNPLENEAGLSFTYQTFVEDVLGVDMPVGSQISQGGAITIGSSMSFGNDVVVIEGATAIGTDGADEFQVDVSNGGSFAINDFDVEADSLSISGLSEAIGDVLADIHGDTGVGGQAINVQHDPFEQETFINLGIDAEGEVVSLTLSGISETDWSSVALV